MRNMVIFYYGENYVVHILEMVYLKLIHGRKYLISDHPLVNILLKFDSHHMCHADVRCQMSHVSVRFSSVAGRTSSRVQWEDLVSLPPSSSWSEALVISYRESATSCYLCKSLSCCHCPSLRSRCEAFVLCFKKRQGWERSGVVGSGRSFRVKEFHRERDALSYSSSLELHTDLHNDGCVQVPDEAMQFYERIVGDQELSKAAPHLRCKSSAKRNKERLKHVETMETQGLSTQELRLCKFLCQGEFQCCHPQRKMQLCSNWNSLHLCTALLAVGEGDTSFGEC